MDQVSIGMNANTDHVVVTPGSGGLETTKWQPETVIEILRSQPKGTFNTALLAYSWNLFSQDGWEVIQVPWFHLVRRVSAELVLQACQAYTLRSTAWHLSC